MAISAFPLPPRDLDDERKHRREIANSLYRVMDGKTNNVLDVTLNAGSATTTVTDARIGTNTAVICVPATANAAAISMPWRSDLLNGSMTLNHTNDANADKTFKLILVG